MPKKKNTHEIYVSVPDHLSEFDVEGMVNQIVAAGNTLNSDHNATNTLLGFSSSYCTPGIQEAKKLFANSELELEDDGEVNGTEGWTWSVYHEVDNPDYDESDESEGAEPATMNEYLLVSGTLAEAVAVLKTFEEAKSVEIEGFLQEMVSKL